MPTKKKLSKMREQDDRENHDSSTRIRRAEEVRRREEGKETKKKRESKSAKKIERKNTNEKGRKRKITAIFPSTPPLSPLSLCHFDPPHFPPPYPGLFSFLNVNGFDRTRIVQSEPFSSLIGQAAAVIHWNWYAQSSSFKNVGIVCGSHRERKDARPCRQH